MTPAGRRIFHVATAADWAEAQRTGRYSTSTRGRSLAEEGFIHAADATQVDGVLARWYADVGEPLVLLEIDPSLLAAEVRDDPVGAETYPHVYGPIEPAAVVSVRPLRSAGVTPPSRPAAPGR